MPRNEGETSDQIVLAGKQEAIRHFPSKLLDHIRNEARKKKRDRYGEKLGIQHPNFSLTTSGCNINVMMI